MVTRSSSVLIIGGGVAGLALANMLEQAHIDFVVLEQQHQITPDVGASIFIFAGGGRILSQLGCNAKLESFMPPEERDRRLFVRNEAQGNLIEVEDLPEELGKRYGYGFVCLDRRMLIRSLFENLKDKSKVQVGKRIVAIEHLHDKVQVRTTDGDIFCGELVVGADGVHSIVRKEMWRMASVTNPTYFPSNDLQDIPSDYCCIFGVSKPLPHVNLRSMYFTLGSNSSWVIVRGPDNRIYWNLYQKLPERINGLYDNLPRYSLEDRDRMAAEHLGNYIADGLYFEDLWNARETATLTPLPTFVSSKWYYERMILVGDAAHKYTPISGQGANSAIETCAVLTNFLYRLKISKPSHCGISDAEATNLFRKIQLYRHDRVTTIMKRSNMMQNVMSSDGFVLRSVVKLVPQAVGKAILLLVLGALAMPTAQLEVPNIPPPPDSRNFIHKTQSKWFQVGLAALILAVSVHIIMLMYS